MDVGLAVLGAPTHVAGVMTDHPCAINAARSPLMTTLTLNDAQRPAGCSRKRAGLGCPALRDTGLFGHSCKNPGTAT